MKGLEPEPEIKPFTALLLVFFSPEINLFLHLYLSFFFYPKVPSFVLMKQSPNRNRSIGTSLDILSHFTLSPSIPLERAVARHGHDYWSFLSSGAKLGTKTAKEQKRKMHPGTDFLSLTRNGARPDEVQVPRPMVPLMPP